MSDWGKTVMDDEQIVSARIGAYAKEGLPVTDIMRYANIEDRGIAQAQAEITWYIAYKMGYNQALKDERSGLSPADMV